MTNLDVQLRDEISVSSESLHQPLSPPTVLRSRPSFYAGYGKRPFDIALSLLGLIVLSPLLLLLAILVRVMLGKGGIIYHQKRVGRHGQPFSILKFRSMKPDRRTGGQPYIGPERRKTHKSSNDPRHRPFGRFIRASSLDELPQLFNVLRGDMSLIGPRPELVHVAEQQGFLIHPRHLTRPGITGSFQVSKLRDGNKIAAGLHLDVGYVADVRLSQDVKILVKTVGVLANARG